MRQGKLLREQLDGASLSALLNTAKGHGRRQRGQRSKCFDDARGSAIECAACLDASVVEGFASWDRIQAGKEMLVRIVAMLTKRSCASMNNTGSTRAQRAQLRHSSTSTTTSTSTIDQGSKAILGKSSQENKILTDCTQR
jgi:four helix bundle protein